MTALAAAATIGFASSASAAVTVTDTNGTPLANQIYGVDGDDGLHVYGTAPSNGGPANVEYTGNTDIHITSGFAQIQDAGATDGDLFQIVINPDDLFDLMKFSVQLESVSGTVSVYYLLANSGLDANSISSYTLLAGTFTSGKNDNENHLISGSAGEIFDGIMISTSDPISLFQVKQNSYNGVAAAVPEPATWGMMLLGFAGIGMAMRRRRRSNGALMQIA
jgi:hypothetical protein